MKQLFAKYIYFLKISILSSCSLIILALFSNSADAYYRVSGIVDFTYTSYKTKIGNSTSTTHTWIDHYGAGLDSSLWDPRFLLMNARVDYSTYHLEKSADQSHLSYRLAFTFFPKSAISWSLYDAKTISNVPSSGTLAGYDLETISRGGTLDIRMSRARRKSNNGNNYYNRNNNNGNNNSGNRRRGIVYLLPDITIDANHVESQTFGSTTTPLHETRDNGSVTLNFLPTASTHVHIEGRTEKYKNLVMASGYDTKTVDLLSTTNLPGGDLQVTVRSTERNYENVLALQNTVNDSSTWLYGARLYLRGKNRVTQIYNADYSKLELPTTETETKRAMAQIIYTILPELTLQSSANFLQTAYRREATATTPADKSEVNRGDLSAGIRFYKEFKPEIIDPFILHMSYDLATGYGDVNSVSSGQVGSGIYYQNTASFGAQSSGWKFENVAFRCSYVDRRDHSPLHMNMMTQSYEVSAATTRIRNARMNVSAQFTSSESSVGQSPYPVVAQVSSSSIQSRDLTYRAAVDYAFNANISLTSGANRSEVTTNSTYSLATLPVLGTPEQISERFYATLAGNYSLSRTTRLRITGGEEYVSNKPSGAQTTSYVGTFGLLWRIRQIDMSLEYRWREDIPQNGLRSIQDYLFVRASRPF